jgi:hypothetical protein
MMQPFFDSPRRNHGKFVDNFTCRLDMHRQNQFKQEVSEPSHTPNATSTTEPKNAVAKLTIANSGKTGNREIREESEIVGKLHRNYK